MASLASKKLSQVKKDSASATKPQVTSYLGQLPGWKVLEPEEVPRLERTFSFKNFLEALDFVNRVGEIAEEVNHHPEILFTWGRATVRWWTHDINGLHENDFIMAARTDELYQG